MIFVEHVKNILEIAHVLGDHEREVTERVFLVELKNLSELSFSPLVVLDGSKLI